MGPALTHSLSLHKRDVAQADRTEVIAIQALGGGSTGECIDRKGEALAGANRSHKRDDECGATRCLASSRR